MERVAFVTEAPDEPDPVMGDPGESGLFGDYGGRYVPEPLLAACRELEDAFRSAWADPVFRDTFARELSNYAGRPSPVTELARLSEHLGLRLLLKREDLTHTGSHKINNVVGQALLARRMGKRMLIAETGAGQHGVAVATVAAMYDMKCVVYMGQKDMRRQALNVFRMELLGAEVIPVTSGSRTLKDAVNEATRRWVADVADAHFCDGSVVGPHPYPWMVREFQRVIGDEARVQCRALLGGRDPDVVVACVGGGSNAAGVFAGFAHLPRVALVGAEATGSAAVSRGLPGVLHGAKSFVLQDEHGQILESEGISAGLGYPGIGPEHSHLASSGRARYVAVSDSEALDAFRLLARNEGIVPALESAHAVAWVSREREALAGQTVLVNLSGRGDKDVDHVRGLLGR
ncbi:MAG: tryptophan synthase subunit beta [Trebonia sp.]